MHPHIERGFSLQDRVAVITGAGSGIGRETAILFAEAGAHVVIADLNTDGLRETANAIGDQATIVITNVTRRAEVDNLASAALEVAGRVDVWANVAGTLGRFALVEAEEEEVDRIIAVNLKGVYWGCAAAGRAMIPRACGSIINVSSNGAETSPPGLSAYAMTKAGVNAITRSAAKELGSYGIRANTVAPGFIETPLASAQYTREDGSYDQAKRSITLAQRQAASPLGLTGEPTDIAYAMLYLACDASRFVTGQIIRPNGGVSMP